MNCFQLLSKNDKIFRALRQRAGIAAKRLAKAKYELKMAQAEYDLSHDAVTKYFMREFHKK